jgi:hypothetical protein
MISARLRLGLLKKHVSGLSAAAVLCYTFAHTPL